MWRKHGYRGLITRTRPCVCRKFPLARMEFAKEHEKKCQEFLDQVIWSDETKVNIFNSGGILRIWRKASTAHEHVSTLPTVKHGGESMRICGCMSLRGIVMLHVIDGTMVILSTSWRKMSNKVHWRWCLCLVICFSKMMTLNLRM